MGATPLFYAISQNNTEMVQLLIKHGARIDSLITLEDEVRLCRSSEFGCQQKWIVGHK